MTGRRVETSCPVLERTTETTGTFLWKPGTVTPRLPFRKPRGPDHRRGLADISIAELVDFILTHPAAVMGRTRPWSTPA